MWENKITIKTVIFSPTLIFLLVLTLGVGGPPGPASGVAAVGGGPGGGPGLRASGRRGPGQGVEPLAAQAAAAAQVRTYRDNGVKHSTSSYNRVCLQSSIALSFADLSLSSPHLLYNNNTGYLSLPTYLTPGLLIKFFKLN